jgi:hypothetical protein
MVKASIVIMSHLSDAQELTGLIKPTVKHDVLSNVINRHINFAKFLLLKYRDTNTYINADKEYAEFQKSMRKRGQDIDLD